MGAAATRIAVIPALVAAFAFAVAGQALGATDLVFVTPAADAIVGGVVRVSVSAPPEASWVDFSLSTDGTSWAPISTDGDGSDGWWVAWDSRPREGRVWLRATSSDGATATLPVVLDNAPPGLVAWAEPRAFSPNGDGRRDRMRVRVRIDEGAHVRIRIRRRGGDVVRVASRQVSSAGLFGVRWDGRSGDGRVARDGVYLIRVSARDAAGNVAVERRRARLDTKSPRLRWLSDAKILSGRRALVARFRVRDAASRLRARFRLESAYGRGGRRWRQHLRVGRQATRMSRRAVARTLPGAYRIRVVLADPAGNRSRPRPSPVYRIDHSVRTRVVARMDDVGRRVALTFDDCAYASSWDSILRTLARHHVTAGFFCPGQQVRAHPRLARRTIRAGHTIGSHGWDHATLTARSYASVLWRLRNDRNVWWRWRAAATPYFRPPYGAFGSTVLSAAGALGYRYAILWDVDPRDWANPGVGAIVARAVGPARPGSIILLHVKPQTAAALPAILRRLHDRELRPVGLDRLIHLRGAHPSRGGWSRIAARRRPAP